MLEQLILEGPIMYSNGLTPEYLRKVALLEVNLLLLTGRLDSEFEGLELASSEEEVFALNGDVVFHRVALARPNGDGHFGFVEFAVNPIYGGVLLAVGRGMGTLRDANLEKISKIVNMSAEAANEKLFVYSYPKVGFRDKEGRLLDVFFGEVIDERDSEAGKRDGFDPCVARKTNASLSEVEIQKRRERFDDEAEFWRPEIENDASSAQWSKISLQWFKSVIKDRIEPVDRELAMIEHLRNFPQESPVGCYAACAQSFLRFYRYRYEQSILAQALKIGSVGVTKSAEHDVVDALEALTRQGVRGRMVRSPEWADFFEEIKCERPVIGVIEGHCRLARGASIVGAKRIDGLKKKNLMLRSLSLLDPYPPTSGTDIRWENFDAISYVVMFGAHVEPLSAAELGVVDHLRWKAVEEATSRASEWNIGRDIKATHVERFTAAYGEGPQDGISESEGWLVNLEEGGKLVGFAEFNEHLGFERFRAKKDGGPYLERGLAEQEILKRRTEVEGHVSEPQLVLENDEAIVWRAETRRDFDTGHIVLDKFRIPVQ